MEAQKRCVVLSGSAGAGVVRGSFDNPVRLCARLDIKGDNLIKSIQYEGLRVIGSPSDFAKKYYYEGVDEILLMDTVASLYGRNHLSSLIEQISEEVFVPITAGGGVRCASDAEKLLKSGADKIAVNTAALKNPSLIEDLSKSFGSQAVVIYVQAKKNKLNGWTAFMENAREPSTYNVLDWCELAEQSGAGEILLSSVDCEGVGKGFDLNLVHAVGNAISIPLIISGGMGVKEDFVEVAKSGLVDAVASARALHYSSASISNIKDHAAQCGLALRWPIDVGH